LIAGDSAGGNLSLAVLSHLLHTHPGVQSLPKETKLGAAMLVSPWASFSQTRLSWTSNVKSDALDKPTIRIWERNFMGSAKSNGYTEAAEASSDWWKGLSSVVEQISVLSGEKEIIRDDVRALVENMKVHNPALVYFEAKGEAHDVIIMDRMFGFKEELASEEFVKRWLLSNLA
jgi:acetyl esterase/lipase